MTQPCPQCASKRTHHSRQRGLVENLAAVAGVKMCRCHECNLRFGARGNSVLLVKDMHRLLNKALMLLLMALAMAAIVAGVMWIGRKEASPSSAQQPVIASPSISS